VNLVGFVKSERLKFSKIIVATQVSTIILQSTPVYHTKPSDPSNSSKTATVTMTIRLKNVFRVLVATGTVIASLE
jgi:hypothetical protein